MIRMTEQIYGFGNDLMIGSCGFCYSVIPVYHYKGGKKGPQQKRTANSRSFLFHSLLVLGERDHIACKIRALIAAIEAKGSDNETTKEWIAWATAKADWFDPTVAAKDPFFGTRNHRESKDKKQLTEKRSYYFW